MNAAISHIRWTFQSSSCLWLLTNYLKSFVKLLRKNRMVNTTADTRSANVQYLEHDGTIFAMKNKRQVSTEPDNLRQAHHSSPLQRWNILIYLFKIFVSVFMVRMKIANLRRLNVITCKKWKMVRSYGVPFSLSLGTFCIGATFCYFTLICLVK